MCIRDSLYVYMDPTYDGSAILYSIPGKVPNPVNMPNYCYFKDRCEMALPCCDGEYPLSLIHISSTSALPATATTPLSRF